MLFFVLVNTILKMGLDGGPIQRHLDEMKVIHLSMTTMLVRI